MIRFPEKIDLHIHSTSSDGTDPPEKILEKVKAGGLDLFSLTDHDAFRGCETIRDLLKPGDPYFVTGIEFSCKDAQGKYHILGYGYDLNAESIRDIVTRAHSYRMDKLFERLDGLESEFRFSFPEEDIMKLLSLHNPGKPHIGNLMVQYGYAKDRDSAITQYIDKIKIPNRYISPEDAIRAILDGGGIPVLAHPSYGSGKELYTGKDMEDRLTRLIGYGLQGVEAFYSQLTDELVAELLGFAEKYDLYVTAGSDYHGTNKKNPLGETRLKNAAGGPKGLERFIEAALQKAFV